MIEIRINEVNKFMSRLLKSDDFDQFFFREGKIHSFMDFDFDGERRMDFYDTDELSGLPKGAYVRWYEIKSVFLEQIKGKHAPTLLQVSLVQNDDKAQEMINKAKVSIGPSETVALNINIIFKDSEMRIRTATYRSAFTLDKSLDVAWDTCIKQALTQMDLNFEVL